MSSLMTTFVGQFRRNSSGSRADGDASFLNPKPVASQFVNKMNALRFTLESDLLACDAKWMLFVAAALSYRYDIHLKPLPPRFVGEQEGINIDGLVSVINDTPKLRVVLQNITTERFRDMDPEVLDLLHYVLVELHEPRFRAIDEEEFCAEIMDLVPSADMLRPTHVFEVCKPLTTSTSGGFIMGRASVERKLAYHGNKLERFFSIINRGFNLNTEGENHILLSTNFMTALENSPNGAGWGASSCGSMVTCVALCEYTLHPEHVDEINTEVLVRDEDLLRVRYLMFYGSRFPDDEDELKSGVVEWMKRHKYALSVACYVVMLASLGYVNSGSIIARKLVTLVDFCKRIIASEVY